MRTEQSSDAAINEAIRDLLPKISIQPQRHRLTMEHKAAILEQLPKQGWKTVREAYGWAWTNLGVRVNYLTVWRFLNAGGHLNGDVLRARRLSLPGNKSSH